MARVQNDGQHEYLVIPDNGGLQDYNTTSTYDQFIQLRDTLVFTGKQYSGKAGLKLCVGDREDTIEVAERQFWKQIFEPDWKTGNYQLESLGTNITQTEGEDANTFGPLSCIINKDGRYRIMHKQEILPEATTEKVYCYVDRYRKDATGAYKLVIKGGIAVFDWAAKGTLTGQTSGTDPNGSCSISFTLGKLFQKMTSYGIIEVDCKKGDVLVLRMKDKELSDDGTNPGNDLKLQQRSNYRSIEYLDLPYNKD